jgi:hypothetical protein
VVAPDGEYLFDVMAGMDEVEPAPLMDRERAENLVTDGAAASEDDFGLIRERVDTGEILVDSLDEFVAGERLGGCWQYGWRGWAAFGEDASGDQNQLACTLCDGGTCFGGPALGDACREGVLREAIGEDQMIDDLLDAPFIRTRGGMQLRLRGVEAFEGRVELSLELFKDWVHGSHYATPKRQTGRRDYWRRARALCAVLICSSEASSLRIALYSAMASSRLFSFWAISARSR